MQNKTNKNTEKRVTWLKRVTDACPHGVYSEFRADIIFRCGWDSRSTFRNKVNGVTDLSLGEYAVIKGLCAKYEVPAFEDQLKTVAV